MICKNCTEILIGAYCYKCGQSSKINKFTFRSLLAGFTEEFFVLDNKFFFTVKKLLIQPRIVVDEYLSGKRKKYFNPFNIFLIVISVLIIFLSKIIPFIDMEITNRINYLDKHSTLIASISVLIYSLLFSLFFKKYNVVESFIVGIFYFILFNMYFFTIVVFLAITRNQLIFQYAYFIGFIGTYFYFYISLYKKSFSFRRGGFLWSSLKLIIIFLLVQIIITNLMPILRYL